MNTSISLDIQIIRSETHHLAKITEEMQTEEWETLDANFTLENLTKFVENPDNYLLLAYKAGEVAGMLDAYNLQKMDGRGKEMFLYEIETKPAFRKQGVAKALILKLHEIAQGVGAHEIWVLTDEENEAGNKLYRSLGVKTVRTNRNVMYAYPISD
jgi:aminoglycoside 3-N-acetyltransferase I